MQFRFRRRGKRTYVHLLPEGRRDRHAVNTAEMYLGTQDEGIRPLTAPAERGLQGLAFLPCPFAHLSGPLTDRSVLCRCEGFQDFLLRFREPGRPLL